MGICKSGFGILKKVNCIGCSGCECVIVTVKNFATNSSGELTLVCGLGQFYLKYGRIFKPNHLY